MSQEQRNSTTPPDEPTTLTRRESGEISVLSSIEERLTQAANPQDIVLWTQVREEIIRQDEESKNQEHRRFLERTQIWFKMGFSVIAFIAGIALLVGGVTQIGLFILGAGLFGFVPDYVKMFFKVFKNKDKGGENAEE